MKQFVTHEGGPLDGKSLPFDAQKIPPQMIYIIFGNGTIEDDGSDPIAVAMYRYNSQRYVLGGVDETQEGLRKAKAMVNERRARLAAARFYQSPNYDAYSIQPVDGHDQIEIELGHRKAHVDEDLAPIILAVWALGLDTTGSCQNVRKDGAETGKSYIGFIVESDARQFEKLLNEHDIPCEFRSKTARIGNADRSRFVTLETGNVTFRVELIPRIVEALRKTD